MEKEALAIVYGIKKFHQYIYGRKFTLVTDHKPLTTIINPKAGLPALAAAQLHDGLYYYQLISMTLCFDRLSNMPTNVDCLSCLPLSTIFDENLECDNSAPLFNINQTGTLPVEPECVQQATSLG